MHAQSVGTQQILLRNTKKVLILVEMDLRDDYWEGCRKLTVSLLPNEMKVAVLF